MNISTCRRTCAVASAILAISLLGASPAAFAQRGVPSVGGAYAGQGALDETCVTPQGSADYHDTIVSITALVTQDRSNLRIEAPFVAVRGDGSSYKNYFIINVVVSARGEVGGVADYMYDSDTVVHLVTLGTFQADNLQLTLTSHITYLSRPDVCDQTIAVNLTYNRSTATARLSWLPPAGGDRSPPRNLRAQLLTAGHSDGRAEKTETPRDITGYNVYGSTSPDVQTTPENLIASVPPSQTTIDAGVAPSGSFFVVTTTSSSGESPPSNEADAGTPGAAVSSVTLKNGKLVAKGTGFTTSVLVFVDGIPFVSAAKVKAGTKVTQKGNLLTGQSIASYFTAGRTVEVSYLNNDSSITRVMVTK